MSEDADAATYFAPPLPDECMQRVLRVLQDDSRGLLKATCLSRDWRRVASEFIWRRWVLGRIQDVLLQRTVARMTDENFADLARKLGSELEPRPPSHTVSMLDLRLCSGLTMSGILHALDAAALTGRVRRLYVLGVRAPDVTGAALADVLHVAATPNGGVDALWQLQYWNLDDSALRRCGRGLPHCDGLCVALSPDTVCHGCKTLDMQHPRPLRLGLPLAERDARWGALNKPCDVDGCTRPANEACGGCNAAFCRSCAGVNLFSCDLFLEDHEPDCSGYPCRCPMCSSCIAYTSKDDFLQCARARNECFGCYGHWQCSCFDRSLSGLDWQRCTGCDSVFCGDHKLNCCEDENHEYPEQDSQPEESEDEDDWQDRQLPAGEVFCDDCASGIDGIDAHGSGCLTRCSQCRCLLCTQHVQTCEDREECEDCVSDPLCSGCVVEQEDELNVRRCSACLKLWCRNCAPRHFTDRNDIGQEDEDQRCDDCVREDRAPEW